MFTAHTFLVPRAFPLVMSLSCHRHLIKIPGFLILHHNKPILGQKFCHVSRYPLCAYLNQIELFSVYQGNTCTLGFSLRDEAGTSSNRSRRSNLSSLQTSLPHRCRLSYERSPRLLWQKRFAASVKSNLSSLQTSLPHRGRLSYGRSPLLPMTLSYSYTTALKVPINRQNNTENNVKHAFNLTSPNTQKSLYL